MKGIDLFLLGWLAIKLIVDAVGFVYLIWRLSNGNGH